ncbi:MAG TPA: hypothetical protein VLA61_11000 [Ideonella sp.]|uniref:hypothetical protein n=1 Tax=Ideonella sp. TaxID=1929293 RepID=UPI002CF75615|nr:hypothetical protein [Ideonella sp.]HSI48790.1 hypothetical protein [Ideonella sp.]
MNDDETRDAYLQSALKHAPDALNGPPPALSEAILREAQAKARDPRPAPPTPARVGWWDWLRRPSAASGFAGLMLAVLVGLMWRDHAGDLGPLQEPAPRTAPLSTAPQADRMAEAAAPPAVVMPAAPEARRQPEDKLKRQNTEAAPKAAKLAPPAPLPATREAAPPQVLAEARPAPAMPAPTATAAPAAPPAPPAALAKTSPMADAAAPAPSRVTEAAKPAAIAPDLLAQADDRQSYGARMELRPEAQVQNEVGTMAGTATGKLAAMPPAAAMARSGIASAPAATPLMALRQAVAMETARWTWQRGSEAAPRAMNRALLQWLDSLDSASADAAWQPVLPAGGAPLTALRLLRDGQVSDLLWLDGETLNWQHGTQAPRQFGMRASPGLPLQPTLQQALDEATR